jgi:hypothetical protein
VGRPVEVRVLLAAPPLRKRSGVCKKAPREPFLLLGKAPAIGSHRPANQRSRSLQARRSLPEALEASLQLVGRNILGHKLAFTRSLVEALKAEAWSGTVAEIGRWWSARDSVEVDVENRRSMAIARLSAARHRRAHDRMPGRLDIGPVGSRDTARGLVLSLSRAPSRSRSGGRSRTERAGCENRPPRPRVLPVVLPGPRA